MSKQPAGDVNLRECRNLLRNRKYVEAETHLQNLLQRDPEDEDILELLGLAQFLGKNFAAAKATFEQLTQVNPGHVKAWVNLGAVLNRMGEHRKAVDVLRRTLQKDRRCAEAYYNMGIAQRAMNLNTMAISAYKEAVKLKPDLIEAHLNLGNLYVEMRNMGMALRCFQEALKQDPDSKKAKAALENATANQKILRKETSPFGRLVDIKELDRQQAETTRRILPPAERITERELVQNITKKVRTNAREMLPLLAESLPAQLHRLERIILQTDHKMSSAEHVETFAESVAAVSQLQSAISVALAEIRQRVNPAD